MANPTAREQELLELINRMRTAPAAELALLLNSADLDIQNALDYFQVSLELLQAQWNTLKPTAPLAWSSQLNDMAASHNQVMIQYDQQSHQVGGSDAAGNFIPYEPDFRARLVAVNYNFNRAGENIYAYATSIIHTHAGLAIDWGGSPATGGIQDPAGHRDNMMSSNFREVGISVTDETNPNTQVGPLVVTQEFGNRRELTGKAWLLGVAFQDTDKDGGYDAGEGLNDVRVNITGINGTRFANTISVADAGGYQELLNPGQYQVDFLRNSTVIRSKNISIAATAPENIKFDLVVPVLNLSTRNDFNGDGKSDILWQNENGSVATWLLDGSTVTKPSVIGTLTNDWTIAGTGDFNGDASADILLRNTNSNVAIWQTDGSTVTQASTIGTAAPDWKIDGIGDFNGDGNSDVLWRNVDGTIATWQTDGSTVTKSSIVGSLTPDWKIAGTADFNGDGKADILLQNTDGTVALWEMNGAAVINGSSVGTLNGWSIAGTADFNGDGKADILLRNINGDVAKWQMNGGAVTDASIIGAAPTDWQIVGTGDFNGDKNADILWRNDSGGVATWQMNGATILAAGATSIPTADPAWKIAAPIL